jgi:4-cresol dehydrogenase (hydroxylating) flavoprotein subunit
MKNLKKAIKAWTTVLSHKRVIVDEEILKRESKATFKTSQKIPAILKPINSDEVSSILKIATKNTIPVYPISGGKNWGLGSKVPPKDGVLIDLSMMKKIVRFDETMAYITVEPGVTFREAEAFLNRKKSALMLDTIGSTPDASIIGNTAERGHGMALYADRFNFVCGFEVVLPNGDIIDTGFENFEDSKLGPLAKWGVGPYVDGLFTQSNLGIITRLTIWLRPKPKFFQSFIFHVNDEKNLAEIIDRWRQMGLEGLDSSLRIFNEMRMISIGDRFPENEELPLPEELLLSLRKKHNIGKWVGLGGLYSISKQHAKADREYIVDEIKKLVDDIEFYDQARVDLEYSNATQDKKDQLDFLFNKSLLRGYTSVKAINMAYWRKPDHIKVNDLHEDGCGVLWYCPAIPFTGADVRNAIKICKKVCHQYGFELNIGFLFISQRTLDITGAICYDRNKKGEDEKAMECHHELLDIMVKHGYSPYRLGIQSMDFMKRRQKSSKSFVKKLKASLDEKNILAPGRYIE